MQKDVKKMLTYREALLNHSDFQPWYFSKGIKFIFDYPYAVKRYKDRDLKG